MITAETHPEEDTPDASDRSSEKHHATVARLFQELDWISNRDRGQELLDQIATELEVHAQIEEEIFCPAVQRIGGQIWEALSEHQG